MVGDIFYLFGIGICYIEVFDSRDLGCCYLYYIFGILYVFFFKDKDFFSWGYKQVFGWLRRFVFWVFSVGGEVENCFRWLNQIFILVIFGKLLRFKFNEEYCFKNKVGCIVWWYRFLILSFGRLIQRDFCEFEIDLGCLKIFKRVKIK